MFRCGLTLTLTDIQNSTRRSLILQGLKFLMSVDTKTIVFYYERWKFTAKPNKVLKLNS
jgi:hypothetical protein